MIDEALEFRGPADGQMSLEEDPVENTKGSRRSKLANLA